jgi:hypothetical protein
VAELAQASLAHRLTVSLDDIYDRLPRLRESVHRVTSPPSDDYNCAGWVVRDLKGYFAPGLFWPEGIPKPEREGDEDLEAYLALFRSWGYEECDSPDLEPGLLKIAIYAKDGFFHHVAKQLRSGAWSSKIGQAHDLRHEDLSALDDSAVFFNSASATIFMQIADDGADALDIEERGYLLS